MTWQALNEATEAYAQKKKLERIAKIVASHPEWQQVEPELKVLLQAVKAA